MKKEMAMRLLVFVGVISVVTGQNWLGPQRNSRCGQLLRTNDRNSLNIQAKEDLVAAMEDVSNRVIFSIHDVDKVKNTSKCAPIQKNVDCYKNNCFNLRYRTLDGTCNNYDNALWGASDSPFYRAVPPRYQDGITQFRNKSRDGHPLPNARDLSKKLLFNESAPINERLNTLVMQWGQFILHDTMRTAELRGPQCDGCSMEEEQCTPIQQFPGDPHCGNIFCCEVFVRQPPICGTGFGGSPRQQANEVSTYLDASHVYSVSTIDSFQLRDGAFLKTTVFQGKTYAAFDPRDTCKKEECDPRMLSGDNRIKIFVGLTSLQVLFVREHNRVARELQRLNPQWDVERLYQETRKIIGAEMQIITYKEWFPKILGWDNMQRLMGQYSGYRSNVNPTISNEFAHAAMRFGHALIPDRYNFTNGRGEPIDIEPGNGPKTKSISFLAGTLEPHWMLFNGIVAVLRGLSTMPLKYGRLGYQITEKVFQDEDLGATNIQRGRDVGLGTYNDIRDFCRLRRATTFDDLSNEIRDADIRRRMANMYSSPDDVDFYVGGLLEDAVPGGIVGPTFSCILANQFQRLRDGDRFWYQSPTVFTQDQLNQLERVSFSRLFCDNDNDLITIPVDGFTRDQAVSCSQVPGWNLVPWTEGVPEQG